MNLTIFIIGNLAHLFVKWLDVLSSRAFSKLGIKEMNPLFRDSNRVFSEWRAWIGIGLWHVIAIILYVVPSADNTPEGAMQFWHPLYSLGVFVLSFGFSLVWYFENKKAVKRRGGSL